jgi:sulfide dehydrogenase cytochrome subunit
MKKTLSLGAALLVSGIAFSGASFAGGASAEALAYTCAGCHGTSGASMGPATPSLAGMSEAYFKDVMISYKEGARSSTIMERIAKGYDEDDFGKMAKFFAKQKRHVADQKGGPMADKGAKIHDKYCEKCHSEGGTIAEDDSGFLSGQWRPYLEYSMQDVFDGKREVGKKMMKKVKQAHKKHGDDMVPALMDYYAGNK